MQTLNYTYNIRGWLTDINHIEDLGNDLFAFGLRYNSGLQNGSTALYNGNIAETHWKSTQDLRHRMYRYNYDGLNRLTQAHYTNVDVNNTLGNYNESLTYDKNGNIQALQRNGFEENIMYNIPIDNLKYFYDPNNKNVLKKVVDLTHSAEGFKDDASGTEQSDTADDYEYDQFGNMTKDQNKHITSITYNHLNLPLKINFDTGSYITYLYDATGVKTKKTVYTYSATAPTSAVTEYLGTFQYRAERKENSRWLFLANEPACRVEANGLASEVELQFIFTAEGYYNVVSFPTTGIIVGAYIYNYTDHLGNIRLSYTLDQATQQITPLEEHHYYPFGLEHKYYNSTRKTYDKQEEEVTLADGSKIAIVRPVVVQVPNSGYQYQYNGKEFQDELGLNMTAMDFRQYDNALGRFVGMDRLSEMAVDITPYRFALNNPVYFGDPTGLWEKKDNGSWFTNDKKDIERFMNMLSIENENNGGVSGAQMDLFINEEFQGSGGRLSDGSALLDEVSLKSDKYGNTNGFTGWQASRINSQIERFVSNSYNEKSFGSGSRGHWAYSYKYFRERNYYENGGQGMSGVALSGFVLDLTSDFMHNNKFWMGKNLKFYDVAWGGNGFTGGRNKFVAKWSACLDVAGKLATVYGMYGTANDYFKQGKFSGIGASYLGASDGVGLGNIYGSAWSLGTGIGKAIVESEWYFNEFHKDYNW